MTQRINEVWAWIAVDEETGEEAVLTMDTPVGTVPLFSTDATNLDFCRDYIQQVVEGTGQAVALVRFSSRSIEEVVGGKSESEVN